MENSPKSTLKSRLDLYKTDLSGSVANKFNALFTEKEGDWNTIKTELTPENGFQPDVVKKLEFTNALSLWSNENAPLIKAFQDDNATNSLRDIALNLNKEALVQKIIKTKSAPEDVTPQAYAAQLQKVLFKAEPTATLQRLVSDIAETPIADKAISENVATFLKNQPLSFNIATTSVYSAFKEEDAFKDIAPDMQETVKTQLKSLQRVVAISPVPEAIPVLMKTNMTTAMRVSEVPEGQFIKGMSARFGENGEVIAKEVHTAAVNVRIRNENVMVKINEVMRGTGIAFIDDGMLEEEADQDGEMALRMEVKKGKYTAHERVEKALSAQNLSWDALFGDADFCECGECTSVYSAAAYFVELLQYLRNNNLDPDADGTVIIRDDPKDISDTPLEKLFERRPDLGCLELTCSNTNTILPYIDLVNEVMENFIVYHHTVPFNVTDETSSELLAQPQHTEYDAYCILHKTVYPFTLPYHQPVDATRIFLNYLGTSRYELINEYRSPAKEKADSPNPDPENIAENDGELVTLHDEFLTRASDAEFLNITQEEYVILTKEAFVSKTYWDKQCDKEHTQDEYNAKIGVKAVQEYYGYDTEEEMLSMEEQKAKGLTFVKLQFLRRTGILYTDLVELLKTQCLNPNIPTGKALTILESIRFSYRYLQSLVNESAPSPKGRYEKLIKVLMKTRTEKEKNPCKPEVKDCNNDTKDIEKWVYCYFEQVGKIIVLDSGDGPLLPIEGDLYVDNEEYIGTLKRNGEIIDEKGDLIGKVDYESNVKTPDGKSFCDTYAGDNMIFVKQMDSFYGSIVKDQLLADERTPVKWLPVADSCNLDTVRLIHLDGTSLTVEEYDKMQRYIRLWRKMGWTIDEVDKALVGLSKSDDCGDSHVPGTKDCGCDDLFGDNDDCDNCDDDEGGCHHQSVRKVCCHISPEFLHELVAVKGLLDKSGLELIKLLTCWTNISIAGEKSLYSRLFLTHNVLGIDKVFKADENGNYLTQDTTLTEHIPAVMAALNLNSDDINAIMAATGMTDKLTLDNLSLLYRYRILSKVIGLKINDFITILPLFGQPFTDAYTTLTFINRWEMMEDAGFTFRQLNYIIRNYDDPNKPLAADEKTILLLAKKIYDGLNDIDTAHRDLLDNEQVSTEVMRAKASLLFEQVIVEQIRSILEGTSLYTTNAPKNLNIVIAPDKSLSTKLVYDKTLGNIQITGILTPAEKIDYQALSNDPAWAAALTRIEKQQAKNFKIALFDIFNAERGLSNARGSEIDAIELIIMGGDIIIPPDQIPDGESDTNTAPKKRIAFMTVFLPYLRRQLSHRFLVETLSGAVNLDAQITDVLISSVLQMNVPATPIYNIFQAIKESAKPDDANWNGYIIPASNDLFTFIVKDSDNKPVCTIDGKLINFTAQEDPTNEWWSEAIQLQAGKLYKLSLTAIDLKNVNWKTTTSAITAIPSSQLLPDFAAAGCQPAFELLKKTSVLVTNFNLSAEEVVYLSNNKTDFDGLDFNSFSLAHWLRLKSYTSLRDSLPVTKTNVLSFFKWMHQPDDATKVSDKIAELTLWKKDKIDKLIATGHFNLNAPAAFYNEINLIKLASALAIADKTGIDPDLLFDWAKPGSNFKKCREITESIQKAIRSKYNQEDWEQVVKPLNDQLRNNQRDALIAYLLQITALIKWGVSDADSLFEFFLIDVQMDACMETSRIKQAISSVQLFIQRCLLGLEKETSDIGPEVLDRDRWDWMQRYRVWEANRKVFLYPENWIESNLRDDKTSFFKELEGELLQKDIQSESVVDALKSYLYKLDEVANMEAIGLHIEMQETEGGWVNPLKLHVFSRTKNAPYFFYYRHYDIGEGNWYPWEKMQIDIPVYDVEDSGTGQVKSNGCYLIPVSWNNRLLVFFPQLSKKSKPNPARGSSIAGLGNDADGMNKSKPIDYWEIKMGWSELRNGKWTQKQLSTGSMAVDLQANLHDLPFFKFVPSFQSDGVLINVDTYLDTDGGFAGAFKFEGSTIFLNNGFVNASEGIPINYFNKKDITKLYTWQLKADGKRQDSSMYFDNRDDGTYVYNFYDSNTYDFYEPNAGALLGLVNQSKLSDFFGFNLNITNLVDAFGSYNLDGKKSFHELKQPYSLYNWELFFHVPMMLANALSKSQQYEEAMKWYHFVFNPMADEETEKRFWRFQPFRKINSKHILESIFNNLDPNEPNQAITEWRNDPFKPHLVARSRPVAYMKWVVMRYIDNLIAWGDYLFRQDTIETINQATQLYILASHILGPRPQMIPKRGKTEPQTYRSLLGKWDAFSNALTELELALPFSNQPSGNMDKAGGAVATGNIFGVASSLYFCIPNNPTLMGYWDTISDRLFKIRHCENIEGVFRKLPLFEPPIDPALLVNAAAQGISIASVLNDLNTPLPNYRFYYLLQKAIELCSELKSMGSAILSVMEKKDNEAIAVIRAKHESSMHQLVMEIKKQQLEEANRAMDGLVQNRKTPEHRMKYYLKLIGADLSSVPGLDVDFNELANAIEQPVDESGLKLLSYEKEDMDKASAAADWQIGIGIVETLASVFHALPSMSVDGKPFGVGAGVLWGFPNLANATTAVGRGLKVYADNLSYQSSSAGKKGGFLRSLQDRVMQANSAGYEIKQIDKQILSQQIRIDIANQEINNQQKMIDNAAEIEDFLKSKYTNDELYSWMKDSLRTLYHQVYNLAYELAKKAEKVYCFERGLTSSNFIQTGYWNAGRDGFLAGEQLFIGLKQLEAAYHEERGHDYEITKHVSIRQINPLALEQLKETGKCEFELPEILFDMDYPGHYKRRMKSVSLTLPCIAGPYTGLNATLRLLSNKFRNSSIATKADYAEKTDEADDRFNNFIIPIDAIAASTAQSDSGMFELNFKDERYIPFEGAGAISKWRLELPLFRQFDYDTISDIIVHIRYTSSEGGEQLKVAASESVNTYVANNEDLSRQQGLFALVDLQHDLPNQWHKAMQVNVGDTARTLTIDNIADFLPYFIKRDKNGKQRDVSKITITDIVLLTHSTLDASTIFLSQDGDEIPFTDSINQGNAKVFAINENEVKVKSMQLVIKDVVKPIEKAVMVLRFTVK